MREFTMRVCMCDKALRVRHSRAACWQHYGASATAWKQREYFQHLKDEVKDGSTHCFFFVWTPRQFAPMIISVHLLFIVWIIYIQPFGNRYQWSVMSQLQSVILTTVLPSLLVFISGDRGGWGCPIKGVFPFLAIVCVTCMSLQAFRVR